MRYLELQLHFFILLVNTKYFMIAQQTSIKILPLFQHLLIITKLTYFPMHLNCFVKVINCSNNFVQSIFFVYGLNDENLLCLSNKTKIVIFNLYKFIYNRVCICLFVCVSKCRCECVCSTLQALFLKL